MRLIPRKRMIVDPRTQGALVLRVAVYWLFSMMSVGLVLVCWDIALGPWGPFFDPTHLGALWDKYAPMGIAALMILPVVLVDALLISNRIVGPLHRMRARMRDLSAGQTVEHIQFRKRDYWPALADDFNAVVDYAEHLKRQAQTVGARAEREEFPELEPAGIS